MERAEGPYDARAIANFILDESDAAGFTMYPTSLLKILYFGHGWHLALFGGPLIAQPFEAWEHGPVVRVVYDQIKDYSGKAIKVRLKAFNPRSMTPKVASAEITRGGAYGSLHPYKLSEMTHESGSPWTSVWEAAQIGASPGARLNDGEIRDYFLRQNHADVLGIG